MMVWFQKWWKDVNSINLPTRNTAKQFEKLEIGDQGGICILIMMINPIMNMINHYII